MALLCREHGQTKAIKVRNITCLAGGVVAEVCVKLGRVPWGGVKRFFPDQRDMNCWNGKELSREKVESGMASEV